MQVGGGDAEPCSYFFGGGGKDAGEGSGLEGVVGAEFEGVCVIVIGFGSLCLFCVTLTKKSV